MSQPRSETLQAIELSRGVAACIVVVGALLAWFSEVGDVLLSDRALALTFFTLGVAAGFGMLLYTACFIFWMSVPEPLK